MSICEYCSKIKKTCCQLSDIILTDKDIERIESKNFFDFFEFRFPQDYDYGQDDDPNWDLYTLTKDKKMQLLKRKNNGDCIFLQENGCILDINTRPLICRIYPYYYNEEKILELDPYKCPQDWVKSTDEKTIEKELNVPKELAEQWRKTFYDELKKGKIYCENRNNL